jgi:hypothetical protein
MTPRAAAGAMKRIEDRVGLPCEDPSRTGIGRIVDRMLRIK